MMCASALCRKSSESSSWSGPPPSSSRSKQNFQNSVSRSASRPLSEWLNTNAVSFRIVRTPWSRVLARSQLAGLARRQQLVDVPHLERDDLDGSPVRDRGEL